MAKSTFRYVIYIAATAQTVWKALLDGEWCRKAGMKTAELNSGSSAGTSTKESHAPRKPSGSRRLDYERGVHRPVESRRFLTAERPRIRGAGRRVSPRPSPPAAE